MDLWLSVNDASQIDRALNHRAMFCCCNEIKAILMVEMEMNACILFSSFSFFFFL